jgi:hypothetical protein
MLKLYSYKNDECSSQERNSRYIKWQTNLADIVRFEVLTAVFRSVHGYQHFRAIQCLHLECRRLTFCSANSYQLPSPFLCICTVLSSCGWLSYPRNWGRFPPKHWRLSTRPHDATAEKSSSQPVSKSQYFSMVTHFLSVLYLYKNSGSPVGIAAAYRLDNRGVGVWVPVRSRIFTSPYHPDQLWGSPNLLSNS